MSSPQRLDKAKGALIGSALGDTIGLYTEFLAPEHAISAYGHSPSFSLVDPVTKLHEDSHRCRFETRAWTDDTDHTILMILSFLRNGELVPDDFAKRLRTWCEQGLRCLDRLPMGLGNTVGRVVLDKNYLSDPTGIAFSHWDKSGRDLAANGSLMRTTPIGIICMNMTEQETFQAAIFMGAVTHPDPRCALSVAIVSGLVRGLCRGEIAGEADINAVLERAWAHTTAYFPDTPLDRNEFDRHAHAKSLESLVLCSKEMGYVYKCLGSALWCLRKVLKAREDFETAITRLVMHGGDADTNAAVAGALMGAYYGYDELPSEWKDGLRHRDWYLDKIGALCVVAGLAPGEYKAEEDPDTDFDGGKGFLDAAELQRREMEVMEKIILARQQQHTKTRRASISKAKPARKWWQLWH